MRIKSQKLSLIGSLFFLATSAHATIVEFETSLGNFEVNLFDQYTPATVDNFLAYVEDGDYDNTFIHRSVKGFVIQGGGFAFNSSFTAYQEVKNTPHIDTRPPVLNEPVLSNQRGTIAMAKRGNMPNSATSEWFFNLQDNSANLDNQNDGYTVFGQVSDEGMEILEEIAELRIVNLGGLTAFATLPVLDYSPQDETNKEPILEENRVIVYRVTVVDNNPDTAADLEPVLSLKQTPAPAKKKKGGATGAFLGGLFAGILLLRRRWK